MSDDDEDEYVTFGKHLKEIVEGEAIRKRPISVEEQIVTDENGKRRFHGAFTGGFSAGFFNTVDTPLNQLGAKDLCPGLPALEKINASLRWSVAGKALDLIKHFFID